MSDSDSSDEEQASESEGQIDLDNDKNSSSDSESVFNGIMDDIDDDFPPEPPSKKAKSTPKQLYEVGDTVGMHMRDDDDNEVVYFGLITTARKKGITEAGPSPESFFFYEATYFDVVNGKDVGGCYKLLKYGVDIDEEDILGKVSWATCPKKKCKYHMGSEQYEKFDQLSEERWIKNSKVIT